MIAMISGVDIDNLKRSLGLKGGSHAENTWHRWLSFALEANKHPMPPRGSPNSSELLTIRNQANSKAYQALKDEELDVFTAEIFFSLGGYPDYSSIVIPEDNVHGDSEILVPEVPKLAPEEEELYRPIYNRLVDQDKVTRDRELNTPSNSSRKEEKRSLQCIKKIAQHLARDHQLVGLEYYLIACSNTTVGGGWCREYTSRDEISTWVSTKANLQEVFPLYCQHRATIEEVNTVAAKAKPNDPKPPNKSDQDKKKLGGLLNKMVDDLIGYHPAHGFPRVPDPVWAITDRKIPIIVERDDDSEMTPEEFSLGFNGMNARARRHWLADIDSGKFRIKKKVTSNESDATGAGTSGLNDTSAATNSNDQQTTDTHDDNQVDTNDLGNGNAAAQADLDGEPLN
ncbi:uncharacterized protein MELLADRAFT_86318 [Melampsora larici-populina 98AG31]|nr:uncharacterized protein MELLADRAFT_86318 [Melampsora larici-populina 98AG31]EGG06880.1 hypothetical protein MELLADRAFT_86318 [Melampsora larici-populina 98AG31]